MKSQEQKMNQSALKGQIQNETRPQCQTKSLQFRNIAPKAPSAVSAPPAILSCQPPSTLPEASAAVSPKSIIVPAQNYALMQVAGQEGTFSLVALPPSLSPQSSPQIQKALPIPKNLKLPIPRYQPVRSKSTPEKALPARASRMQSPTKSPLPRRRAVAAAQVQPSECLEGGPVVEPSEQVILIDPGSSEMAVTTLLAENVVLGSGSPVEKPVDSDQTGGEQPSAAILRNLWPTSGAGAREALVPASLPAADGSPVKPLEDEKGFGSCLSNPAGQIGNSITVLSPAIFGKAVQIIPSPPRGKIPILPYSKMKSALLPVAKPGPKCASLPAGNLGPNKAIHQKQLPSLARQNPSAANSSGLLGAGLSASPKPAGKKRGRKRKTMEDILAFEAKKKRSLSFFRRRVPEKPAPASATTITSSMGPKDRAMDISKKYRSIRPKPVLVMETLSTLPALKCLDQEILVAQQVLRKAQDVQRLDHAIVRPGLPRLSMAGSGVGAAGYAFLGSRQPHRCPTCGRCFQFKHHLQSHMNSHTNSRPYVCPMCRKTYAHSGSLSTHMKLHHAEGRPRRTLRCEFCEKAFGYVGVYFSHLKEVHKVILTVEPSISQHEEDVPVLSSAPPDVDEQQEAQEDPVELQIKCGRCQAITPTFADMKLHLLYVHGEEVQVRLKEGALQGGREAEDELVKHAAHYWRQLNEKRNMVKCGSCEEEFFSFSKLKRHVHSHHQGGPGIGALEGGGSPTSEESESFARGVLAQGLRTGSAFNCILCKDLLDSKAELLEHWRGQHNCEDPSVLWTVFTAFAESEGLQQGATV